MSKKIDRTGEEKVNNFGSKMVITEYRSALDIDVYFPEYNWTFEHAKYGKFKRGNSPIGTTPNSSGSYEAQCNDGYGERIYLGSYSTKEEAFYVYKDYKEKLIKETIDSYEGKIPEPHYSKLREAMYNYKVEITD